VILGRTDSRGRLVFLLIVFVLFAGALIARLGWWQIARRDDLAASAQRQIYLRTEVPAIRGSIYDRSGTVALASSVSRDRLTINPKRLSSNDREILVALLAEQLGLDEAAANGLRDRLTSDQSYVVIARDLPTDQADAIVSAARANGITTVGVETSQIRLYPQTGGAPKTSLAAHLIGFVNREDEGQYGVERYYQDLLAGTPTIMESDRDANGQPVLETRHTVSAGTPGGDLSLTIDAGLQLVLEQEVMAAWVADRPRSVSAVVMDPYTGAIVAEATYPSYDANDYATVASTDPGRFTDPVVAEVYEPGSVFKLLTVIAGLETKTVTLQSRIDDTGTLKLDQGKTRVSNADLKAMGVMSLADGIAYSRNVVAAKVALGLARTTQAAAKELHEVWTRLGFGSWAARPAPPRSGTARSTTGSRGPSTSRSWGTSAVGSATRTSSSRSGSTRAAPRPDASVNCRCRSCPSSCSGGSQPTP